MKKVLLLLLIINWAFASIFTLRGSLGANMVISGKSPNYAVHGQFMHFIPILPNIRIEKAEDTFTDDIDIIFFYNLLDETGGLSLDLGMGAKDKKRKDTKYNEIMPSVFVGAKINLPLSNLSLKLRTIATKKSDNSGHKAEIMLEYKAMDNLFIDMVMDIGYRNEYFSKQTNDKKDTIFFELNFTI
jgi:hypothetical protein